MEFLYENKVNRPEKIEIKENSEMHAKEVFEELGGNNSIDQIIDELFTQIQVVDAGIKLEKIVFKDFIFLSFGFHLSNNINFLSQRLRVTGLTPEKIVKIYLVLRPILLKITNQNSVVVEQVINLLKKTENEII
jgi:hypothetical protein